MAIDHITRIKIKRMEKESRRQRALSRLNPYVKKVKNTYSTAKATPGKTVTFSKNKTKDAIAWLVKQDPNLKGVQLSRVLTSTLQDGTDELIDKISKKLRDDASRAFFGVEDFLDDTAAKNISRLQKRIHKRMKFDNDPRYKEKRISLINANRRKKGLRGEQIGIADTLDESSKYRRHGRIIRSKREKKLNSKAERFGKKLGEILADIQSQD